MSARSCTARLSMQRPNPQTRQQVKPFLQRTPSEADVPSFSTRLYFRLLFHSHSRHNHTIFYHCWCRTVRTAARALLSAPQISRQVMLVAGHGTVAGQKLVEYLVVSLATNQCLKRVCFSVPFTRTIQPRSTGTLSLPTNCARVE
jgi:hypothetical protein